MIILDTHSLLWWIGTPKKLSKKAQQEIEKTIKKDKILISSISIWEICLLVEKGRLDLTMEIENWIQKVERLPFLQFIPVDNKIAAKSVFLPKPIHADPADRIIIATALNLNASIITGDRLIRSYPHVKSVW